LSPAARLLGSPSRVKSPKVLPVQEDRSFPGWCLLRLGTEGSGASSPVGCEGSSAQSSELIPRVSVTQKKPSWPALGRWGDFSVTSKRIF